MRRPAGRPGASVRRTGAGARILRAMRRLLRFWPDRRPLQVREVAAAAMEAVRNGALAGLSARYLPSRLEITVSPEDHRFLAPFQDELTRAVRRELAALPGPAAGGPWRPLTEAMGVVLHADEQLKRAAPPRVELRYPVGVRRASWHADAHRASHPTTPELTLVLTAADQQGTAVQETVHVWLGLEVPARFLDPETAGGAVLRIRGGRVTDRDGEEWLHHGRSLTPEPPPRPSRAAGSLPGRWDAPWLRLERVPGRSALWCPGGVLIIGREPGFAHLVPSRPSAILSAAHLALWREGTSLVACDLWSKNGSRAGERQLPPGRPVAFHLPVTFTIGSQGLLVIQVA